MGRSHHGSLKLAMTMYAKQQHPRALTSGAYPCSEKPDTLIHTFDLNMWLDRQASNRCSSSNRCSHRQASHLIRWWCTAPTASSVGSGGRLASSSSPSTRSDSTTTCRSAVTPQHHTHACRSTTYTLHARWLPHLLQQPHCVHLLTLPTHSNNSPPDAQRLGTMSALQQTCRRPSVTKKLYCHFQQRH